MVLIFGEVILHVPRPSFRRLSSSSAGRTLSLLTKLLIAGIAIVAIGAFLAELLTGGLTANCDADPLNTLCIPGYAARTLARMSIAYALALAFALG